VAVFARFDWRVPGAPKPVTFYRACTSMEAACRKARRWLDDAPEVPFISVWRVPDADDRARDELYAHVDRRGVRAA
jgi:hypothetical protein